MSGPRPFNCQERSFLEQVAEALPQDARKLLLSDMAGALVRETGDFLQVELPDYDRPKYEGPANLPFEGKMSDARGKPVSVLVNTDQNGRLLEVEFIWWDSTSGTALDWSTVEIADAGRKVW